MVIRMFERNKNYVSKEQGFFIRICCFVYIIKIKEDVCHISKSFCPIAYDREESNAL